MSPGVIKFIPEHWRKLILKDYAIYYAAQHLSVSSMTDEEPGHLVPLLLTGVVQGGVAILVLGM